MEEALRALLRADTAVAAIVGTRVDWNTRPQGDALPAITLHRITGSPGYHVAGSDGLYESVVQVDCWASSFPAAKTLARAVEAALSGHIGGVFRAVFIEALRDRVDDGQPALIHQSSLDIRAWHTAA